MNNEHNNIINIMVHCDNKKNYQCDNNLLDKCLKDYHHGLR